MNDPFSAFRDSQLHLLEKRRIRAEELRAERGKNLAATVRGLTPFSSALTDQVIHTLTTRSWELWEKHRPCSAVSLLEFYSDHADAQMDFFSHAPASQWVGAALQKLADDFKHLTFQLMNE